jgi:periplasmic copper chaperone A
MLRSYRIPAAALLAGILLSAQPVTAHEYKAGDLLIGHPWTRATPASAKTAAGYLTITNNGKEADKLTGASAEGTDTVEVHEMKMENSVMKMRHLEGGIEIKPGDKVELKPGSYHLMMIGLKNGFEKGQMIKGTLTFEKAGKVPVEFKVEDKAGGEEHVHTQ